MNLHNSHNLFTTPNKHGKNLKRSFGELNIHDNEIKVIKGAYYKTLSESDDLMAIPDTSPSKMQYDKDNWTFSRKLTVKSTGGGWVTPFCYHPLELKLSCKRASNKIGLPSLDSCEYFVGFDKTDSNSGFCSSIAVGVCVECFTDTFYCTKCVSHQVHTQKA
jgi:hypothetical protein